MSDKQEVQYSATLDISKAVKSAKELKKTLEDVGKSSATNAGATSKQTEAIKQQNQTAKQQAQEQVKIARLAAQEQTRITKQQSQNQVGATRIVTQALQQHYTQQQQFAQKAARDQAQTAKQQAQNQLKATQTVSQALAQHETYKQQLAKKAESDQNKSLQADIQRKKQSLSEQSKATKQAAQEEVKQAKFVAQARQAVLGQKGTALTAHSNRQYNSLQGIALQLGGQALGQAGAYGRQIYGNTAGAYAAFNQQYTVNPGLRDSQLALRRSQLGAGSAMAGYETFKNNVKAGINNSPLAAPLGIAGDVAGTAAPALAGLMQAVGALKTLNPKAVESLGNAASKIGMAAGKAGILGGAAVGGAFVGLEVGNAIGGAINKDWKKKDLKDAYNAAGQAGAVAFGGGDKQRTADIASMLGAGANTGADIGSTWADMWGDHKGAADIRKKNLGQDVVKDKQAKQDYLNSPEVKSSMARMANGMADFAQDSARQEMQTRRQYSRGMEDIATSRTRTKENRAFEVEGFGIQSGRIEQDYGRNKQREGADYTRDVGRAQSDYSRSVQTNELGVFRTRQQYAIQTTRLEEDVSRQRLRTEQDFAKASVHLAEDTGKDTVRLTEDINRERERSDQDYSRNLAVTQRDQARSSADLKRNYKDSLISILAPGLASSKSYQIAKLQRDFKREGSRQSEDFAQQNSDLQRDRTRQVEDIGRSSSRGFSDINRNQERGSFDINQSKSRTDEDQTREQGRSSADLQRQTTEALVDSSLQLRDTQVNYARQINDLATQHTRATEDNDLQHFRAVQDLQREQEQASREYTRTLTDLDKASKRLTEDLNTELENIHIDRDRKGRDYRLDMTDAARTATNESGQNVNVQDLVNQNYGKGSGDNWSPVATGESGDAYAGNLASKLLGRYANGTSYVPQTGPYILERGERVLTTQENAASVAFGGTALAGANGAFGTNQNGSGLVGANGAFGANMNAASGSASNPGNMAAILASSSEAMPNIDAIRAQMAASLGGNSSATKAGTVHDQAWYTAQSSAAWQKHNADLVANIQSQSGSSDAVSGWRDQMLAQFQMYNNGGLAGGSGNTTGGGAFGGNYTTPGASAGAGLSNGSLEGQGPSWLDNFGPAILAKRQGYRPPTRGGNGGGNGMHYSPTYNIGGGGGMHPQIQQEIDRHKTALNGIANTIYSSVY